MLNEHRPQLPGCFDIIRRGNIPGLPIGSDPFAPVPPPPPLPVAAHRPHQQLVMGQQPVPQPQASKVAPIGPYNKPPFPAVMTKVTFINGVNPTLPTYHAFSGYDAAFLNVGNEEFNAQVWTKPGRNFLSVYPYYDQQGNLHISTWISNYPIKTNKKQTDHKRGHAKARAFASPADPHNGKNLVWEAKAEDISDWIKK